MALRSKDSSDKVRFQAAEAIAMLKDERILHGKLWAMVYSTFADDRVIGIKAMGALGTPKTKEILITKLDDDVLVVRLAAAEQLGRLGDKTGEPEVLDVFRKRLTAGMSPQELEHIYVLAALAIGQIRTEPLSRYLPQLLRDPSIFVRIAAAKAVFQYKMK
jgi:HEAT repeat protein